MQPILYWTECILSCSTVVGWGVPVWWAHPTPSAEEVSVFKSPIVSTQAEGVIGLGDWMHVS